LLEVASVIIVLPFPYLAAVAVERTIHAPIIRETDFFSAHELIAGIGRRSVQRATLYLSPLGGAILALQRGRWRQRRRRAQPSTWWVRRGSRELFL